MNNQALLTPFDILSPEFTRASTRVPRGCYYSLPNQNYTQMRMQSAHADCTYYNTTIARVGPNRFSAHCTCLSGQAHRFCWHKAEAWRVAALMNCWPERFIPQNIERWEGALEMGDLPMAAAFAAALARAGYDVEQQINAAAMAA